MDGQRRVHEVRLLAFGLNQLLRKPPCNVVLVDDAFSQIHVCCASGCEKIVPLFVSNLYESKDQGFVKATERIFTEGCFHSFSHTFKTFVRQ